MKPLRVVVQPEAQKEVDAIRRHQNKLDPKRGRRFIKDFETCLAELSIVPYYQFRKGKYRHVVIGKLPYRLVYEIEDDTVFVYQVRHMSRKPSKKFGP
ncbi:MAG: type II toxin-antitoxin system RelE/ParE family toxin [Flavobacteriales bacterium]|jgi:plasmid stabilization system protein ParE